MLQIVRERETKAPKCSLWGRAVETHAIGGGWGGTITRHGIIHKYADRHRQSHTHRHTPTHRHTHRHTRTDAHTHRHTPLSTKTSGSSCSGGSTLAAWWAFQCLLCWFVPCELLMPSLTCIPSLIFTSLRRLISTSYRLKNVAERGGSHSLRIFHLPRAYLHEWLATPSVNFEPLKKETADFPSINVLAGCELVSPSLAFLGTCGCVRVSCTIFGLEKHVGD